MKNSLPSLLPALALFALGGCASTSGLSTTESDGVYYSSQDRSTLPARPGRVARQQVTQQQLADGEILNPDYDEQTDVVTDGTASTEYYDDDYSYAARIRRFHQPAYSNFGYGYNDFIYTDPFWYGGSALYSPYSYGSFGPYGGFGGLSIGLSFGNPWYRPYGFGYPYGGYGYGYGGFYDSFYSPYGYGGLYSPYYGYGGYYGSPYSYGGYGYGTGYSYGGGRTVRYGARTSRSAEASAGGRVVGSTPATPSAGRGRVSQGGLVAPGSGNPSTNGLVEGNGRGRVQSGGGVTRSGGRGQATMATSPTQSQVQDAQITRGSRFGQLNNQVADQPALQQQQPQTRGWRNTGQAADGQLTETAQPQRRNRLGQVFGGSQPQQQRTYQQPQRSYEAPQRSYEAPTRSYSPPSSSPSRSFGGGGGGGGSFGGGGGGGSRGGGRGGR